MTPEAVAEIFSNRTITRLRRLRYEVGGTIRSGNGPLEIWFAEARPVVLRPTPDGEQLAVSAGPWVDPFAPPLSDENAEFVTTHGKWTASDVSSDPGFRDIVGSRADLVMPVVNPDGAIVGLEATFPQTVLRAEVEADELIVEVVHS